MMRGNPFTASERRGIIAVAALSLVVTGGGVALSYCGRPERVVTPPEVEVLLHPDSVGNTGREDSVSPGKRGKGKERKKGGEKKPRLRRSPLDEDIPSGLKK